MCKCTSMCSLPTRGEHELGLCRTQPTSNGGSSHVTVPYIIIDNIARPSDRVLRQALKAIVPDENWDDDHHRDTPKRFIKMLQELTHADEEAFKFTTFPSKANEMVVVQDIRFTSLCAHHML